MQPLDPRSAISQLGRQLITTRLAEALILGGIDRGGLAEDPINLFADRLMRAGRARRSSD